MNSSLIAEENPSGNFILYDSKCNFCNAVIRFVDRNDKRKFFHTISLYNPKAREILKKRGLQFIDLNTVYLADNSGIYKKSKAVFKILKQLGFPVNTLAVFGVLPSSITDYFYNIIAKNRYKWFGKAED